MLDQVSPPTSLCCPAPMCTPTKPWLCGLSSMAAPAILSRNTDTLHRRSSYTGHHIELARAGWTEVPARLAAGATQPTQTHTAPDILTHPDTLKLYNVIVSRYSR